MSILIYSFEIPFHTSPYGPRDSLRIDYRRYKRRDSQWKSTRPMSPSNLTVREVLCYPFSILVCRRPVWRLLSEPGPPSSSPSFRDLNRDHTRVTRSLPLYPPPSLSPGGTFGVLLGPSGSDPTETDGVCSWFLGSGNLKR